VNQINIVCLSLYFIFLASNDSPTLSKSKWLHFIASLPNACGDGSSAKQESSNLQGIDPCFESKYRCVLRENRKSSIPSF